tara:strand:+ start:416 stop:1774 length:1359 start_codon:yes stop_codon:yes gene_type:complete
MQILATLFLILWLVSLGAVTPASAGDDDIAVIIGNRNYTASIPAVEYAHNDADAMRRYLTEKERILGGNILDLRDASQAAMQSAFGNERTHRGKLWRWLKPGKSRVFVYYSGHGVPGLSDQRGYLLPVDADPDAPEINGFPVDLLYRNLAKLEARSITVFLDACFSGESPRGMLIRSASGVVLTPKLPQAAPGLTVLTAAQGNQVASWDETAKHGLFTRYLLAGLNGAADSTDYGTYDGRVTLAELRGYLDDTMTYAARREFGRIQTATSLGADDTVLSRRQRPAAVAARPLPRPSPQAVVDGQPSNRRFDPNRPASVFEPSPPPAKVAAAVSRPTPMSKPRPGRPQDFDGPWQVEIVFHVNGDSYRYEEDVTVKNGRFEEYLDIHDIRLGQHSQRNWILDGAVDGKGRLVQSLLHYAHVYAISFDLAGTLEQATGTTRAKSWTVSIRSKKR